MGEKEVSSPFVVENIDSLGSMFFGVTCAFSVLNLLPEPELCDDKWLEIRDRILKGSAHLLGLLVWRIQRLDGGNGEYDPLGKLENAEKEIEELKKMRSEDAKANQKVVSIVSAREQRWFSERNELRRQIGGLMSDLTDIKVKNEKIVSDLNIKLKEAEMTIQLKDECIQEGEEKRREIEESLENIERVVDELREIGQRESQRHSSEITKHKTTFIELVSNQRQLEAEMGRALRQVEAAKEEIDSVLEQKEQSVIMNQRLSREIVKMRNELEQKDQILSAMLRKSKLDATEKEMLLKEMKYSKAKKKQVEVERTRWKGVSERKHEKHSLRNILSKHVYGTRAMMSFDRGDIISAKTTDNHLEPYLTDGIKEPYDGGHLENWGNSEAEKYKIVSERRHNLEVEAFAEQLRLKDEKLEAFHCLMSMELETKRLHSHIEGLDHEITQLTQNNLKLESLLLDREAEFHSLKEQLVIQFNTQNLQKLAFDDSAFDQDTVWSNVKVIKRKPEQKNHGIKEIPEDMSPKKDIILIIKSPNKEIKEKKVSILRQKHLQQDSIESDDALNVEKSTSLISKTSKSTWKMDIHALGVSYKIKRLKQQLLMLEKLMGKQESCALSEKRNCIGEKGLYALVSLLNKHVDRYHSLQRKTDNLCERMHEGNLNCGVSTVRRTGVETKRMEQFLEETFQLQRYIVATGQKLMEVQTKIASGFVGDVEEIKSFDMKRFADSIRTLFREVQKGLEVRISRIIGDLGGTLACDGIIHLKNLTY